MNSTPHVAVIGAGVSGLAMIRNLQRSGLKVTCFEKSGQVGGLWNYQDSTELPEDIRKTKSRPENALYKSLRTNLAVPLMMFPDMQEYPCEKGRSDTRLYPGHEVVQRYLHDYANEFRLEGCIKNGHEVVSLERVNDSWRIIWRDIKNNKSGESTFDKVVVCNGHYTKPTLPSIPGIEQFKGLVTHNFYYRRPEVFQHKNVVMLGAGNSGEDISLELSLHAKRVHLCARKNSGRSPAPDRGQAYGKLRNVTQHADIQSCTSNGVILRDGTKLCDIDVLLLTTGFDYEFPFIKNFEELGLTLRDRYLSPLYLDVFCPRYPSLAFVGIPSYTIIFWLAWYQSLWIARVFAGQRGLPSTSSMTKAFLWQEQEWRNEGYAERNLQRYRERQFKVLDRLARLAGVRAPAPAFQTLTELGFLHRLNNPDGYRDKPFPVQFTPEMIFQPHIRKP